MGIEMVSSTRTETKVGTMTTEPETRIDEYGNVHTQASDICELCHNDWPCTANIKWLEGEISSASEATAT